MATHFRSANYGLKDRLGEARHHGWPRLKHPIEGSLKGNGDIDLGAMSQIK